MAVGRATNGSQCLSATFPMTRCTSNNCRAIQDGAVGNSCDGASERRLTPDTLGASVRHDHLLRCPE